MAAKSPNLSCVLCGDRRTREIFRALRPRRRAPTGRHTEDLFGRAGRIVRCVGCGLVRQVDPADAGYDEQEDPEYLLEEQGIRSTFRDILDRIESMRPPPGRLLDVGSGPGLLLDEARSRGWDVVGVEPSAWAVAEAARRNVDVRRGTLETVALEPESFDVVVAMDVIEHVPDPVAFARRVHDLLKAGGIAVVTTPNIDSVVARLLRRWWWSVIPNHLWFFSRGTLEAVLEAGNLELAGSMTHPKTFSVEYYAGRLGGYSRVVGAISRRLGRTLGGRDRLVTPDFHDRIAAIALRRRRDRA